MGNSLLVDGIASKILEIRGKKVMLDRDLAVLYGLKPIVLRQQVRRNLDRFPEDFMFQINQNEAKSLVSQNVIPSRKLFGGWLPYVFTEQGVAMLSSVLHSKQAVLVNIQIMRVFVRMREVLSQNKELTDKLSELERRIDKHDIEIQTIFEAIRQLLEPPVEKKRPAIGFR
jgi:hypothetical protein